jgi:hypothetical protein
MRRQRVLLAYDRIEIADRDWLTCGLLWVTIGTLALGPFGPATRVGRVLFVFTLTVHAIEALYAAIRARQAGLSMQTWFLRTIVLGSLALLTLEVHLREALRPRLIQ